MRIAVISFTLKGAQLNARLVEGLGERGFGGGSEGRDSHLVEGYHLSRNFAPQLIQVTTSLKEWTQKAFEKNEAIIYIGATGIAVRAIAPFIQSKDIDPAVVVLDERGEYVISLLSGHMGGANELAKGVAKLVGGTPIISTATDLNKVFAVDEWAKRWGLHIQEVSRIKYISSALLNEEQVGLSTRFPIVESLPPYVIESENTEVGVVIDLEGKEEPFVHTLHLIPKMLSLGIGCRRGTPLLAIEAMVMKYLEELKLNIAAVSVIATIDLKKDEEGLLAFCQKYNKTLKTYTSEELEAAPGEFTSSEFVKRITRVDNVCERAAVLGSRGGQLLLRKSCLEGVTLAIAKQDYSIHF